MKLLLDLGNTRLKWALSDEGGLSAGGSVPHDGDPVLAVDALAREVEPPAQVWIASVADEGTEGRLADAVTALWPGARCHFPRTTRAALGVTCAYPEPDRMGVDRWLALLGGRRLVEGAFCVLDAGSAVTLDAVDAGGAHLGGLILPGLGMARRWLSEHTGRVRVSGESRRTWWADNTRDAVDGGAFWAVISLAESFCRRTAERLAETPQLLLTGGDAPAIMDAMSITGHYEPDLVLRGLALIAEEPS